MNSIQDAYNMWAGQYDTNSNKTRDLEGKALRNTLSTLHIKNVLEVGCGTGKNSEWLVTRAQHVTAIDFSESMLQKAKEKVTAKNIEFIQFDITGPWNFTETIYDVVCFSLVLEHISNLDFVFDQVKKK